MRITQGSKVEVWTTEAAPPMGAWRAGEVKWGNGHSYIMRWFDGGPDSGRISRKFVRPFPPHVDLPEDLEAGDIVEVSDRDLWKWAEVVRAGHGGDRQFDVKIIGSTKVLTADRGALRVRQVLREDDVWVVHHKDKEIAAVPSRPIAGKNIKSKANVARKVNVANGDDGSKFAAQAFKLGKTKRSNDCMVDSDIVRDVKRFQGNGDTKRPLTNKELAPRYDDNVEVMDVHPNHYLIKKQQEARDNNELDRHVARTDKDSDDDSSSKSDTSSAGSSSCSSSSGGGGSNNNCGGDGAVSATGETCQDQDAAIQPLPSCKKLQEHDSDDRTESRASGGMHHRPANDQAAAVTKQEEEQDYERVHDLELDAYVSVMAAFHATGSLTWEKEELLSNLRLHLHISSDEHLQVIWRLNGKRKPAGGGPTRSVHC
ncbi:uncharacterized protein LOC104583298 [Brachypodium distachyon]|uniref:ENT domain-containing protein n=1 Tax=Brachypodium distachyon TaxID=15368 RepID=A0A0Q3J866_BRADI|nr:uncharacterized protein LOC104583298 [Brachypodium distachyon]KQK08684.1 hypothetical protein BRADI_2g43250v3 [Brachypodium distachyon]|eukprot:XP_014754369.1 uncharacterized protein LOC104583298 [Brachypodium distachyon]